MKKLNLEGKGKESLRSLYNIYIILARAFPYLINRTKVQVVMISGV